MLRVKAVPAIATAIAGILLVVLPVLVLSTTFFGTLWTAIFPASSFSSVNTTTSVTVNNTAPSFSVSPFENPASTSSSPTNVGSNVSFYATATDPNSDNYYLVVCRTNSVTAVNNSSPTCASSQTICTSNATAASSQSTCSYQAQAADAEVVDWYAFVCDQASASGCSSASQGSGNSGSPFDVNHTPLFSSLTPGAAVDPGGDMSFSAVASDTDTDGSSDTVHLVVCAVAGATTAGCTSGADLLCTSSDVASNPSCSYTTPSVFSNGTHNYFAYVFDQHGLASTSNPQTGTYSINNLAPSISSLSLNSGSAINLAVSQTTAVHFTFTVTDNNGYATIDTGSGTIFKLYRTAIGAGSTDDANNHYTLPYSSCSKTPTSSASQDYDCSFLVQYHADPTDVANTQYQSDDWTATAKITDNGALQATSSATPVEMNSLLGVSATATLDYGNLSQGNNSGSSNATITVNSVGNTGLDTLLKGTDMTNGVGGTIPVANQKYNASTFTYGSGGTALSTSDVFLGLHVTKTTVTASPGNKLIYWGIAIPGGISSGAYSGTNTVTAQVSTPGNW